MTEEYIRKQDAVNAINEALKRVFTEHVGEGIINPLEPADVAPVVRCKDCKHHAYDEIFSCYWCEYPGRVRNTTPDGFCEKGEE